MATCPAHPPGAPGNFCVRRHVAPGVSSPARRWHCLAWEEVATQRSMKMPLDGIYGFIYSSRNDIRIVIFTIREEFGGVDFAGRYAGSLARTLMPRSCSTSTLTRSRACSLFRTAPNEERHSVDQCRRIGPPQSIAAYRFKLALRKVMAGNDNEAMADR